MRRHPSLSFGLVRRRRGVTILELTISIAVLLILASLIATVAVGVKERGKLTVDVGHLRQIGAAGAMYATDYDDQLPLSVRPLVAEGRVPQEICRSPADHSEAGLLYYFIEHHRAHTGVSGSVPNCTYIGPADAGWTWSSYSRRILPGENPGWLVNTTRGKPMGSNPVAIVGPYQRLLLDGSVQNRRAGHQSLWLDGQFHKEVFTFGSLFCDQDGQWFEER